MAKVRLFGALCFAYSFAVPLSGQDVPPPNELGPYRVGHALVRPSDRPRTPTLDVWYPSESATEGNPTTYGSFNVTSDVAVEAIEVSKSQKWPLLIYYHGSGGTPTMNFSLGEHLASHGFIVAAGHGDFSAASAIDLMLNPTAELVVNRREVIQGAFEGIVDEGSIGTMGLSRGGRNAYEAALDDDRIKAIMPFAPNRNTGLTGASPDVPAMVLVGTRDDPVGPGRVFEVMASTPRYLGIIEDAGHWSFFDTCSGLAPENAVCSPPFLPNEEVLGILNLYATAFFQTELNGREEYATFLTPEFAASLPVELSAVVP